MGNIPRVTFDQALDGFAGGKRFLGRPGRSDSVVHRGEQLIAQLTRGDRVRGVCDERAADLLDKLLNLHDRSVKRRVYRFRRKADVIRELSGLRVGNVRPNRYDLRFIQGIRQSHRTTGRSLLILVHFYGVIRVVFQIFRRIILFFCQGDKYVRRLKNLEAKRKNLCPGPGKRPC